MKNLIKIIVPILVLSLASCSKSTDNNTGNENPKTNPVFSVKLVDAPAGFDAVNVEILRMRMNLDSGWVEVPVENPGVYNLLDFTNGNNMMLIGDTSVAPGTLSEVRLILGSNNTVVVDSVSYELKTPSGQTSGYKIKMDPQSLEPGGVYSLVIDFDVNSSVHQTGNGKYMLKPVCRGYMESAIGGITGTIVPPNGAYLAEAFNATDTASTPIDEITGGFLIGAALPGTYDVKFFANPGFTDTTITGVIVVAGQVTQMGTISIP